MLCSFQQAANIVRALELFVKPDVLSGDNAYMCAKWVPLLTSSIFNQIHAACLFTPYAVFSHKVQKEGASDQTVHGPSNVQRPDPFAEEVRQLQRRQNNQG